MPTLRFANLGSTSGDRQFSVRGNLYVFIPEDSTTAIVFDLRTYESKTSDIETRVKFKRVGPFEVAILPKSRLRRSERPIYTDSDRLFKRIFSGVKKVYVVNLLGQAPPTVGWAYLEWLFKPASVSNIPLGITDWNLAREEERERDIIREIESTELVDRGQKIEIGPLTLFLFRGKQANQPLSILIAGENQGRSFAFFLGDHAFEKTFLTNTVSVNVGDSRNLSVGAWYAFYQIPAREPSPVEVAMGQT